MHVKYPDEELIFNCKKGSSIRKLTKGKEI